MWLFMLLLTILSKSHVNSEYIDSSSSSSSSLALGAQNDLHEMLNTEKVLIDTLRQYIDTQEQKLMFLKRKTQQIQTIHDDAAADREKYLYNPINAVTILKRFTADWKGLKKYAEEYLNTEDLTKNYTQQSQSLTFPSEDDYDMALINLLRIQDMYKLEPQRLSVGEVNGVKLGSEMSWSDCLEIGLKSSKNGYQTYAKYWIETALDKLPPNEEGNKRNNSNEATVKTSASSADSSYVVKARIEVLKALLNTEYKMGNLQKALRIANEILEIQPKQKHVIKAKQQIETELKKNNGNNNSHNSKNGDAKKPIMKNKTKTDEELMIEEICREASTTQINKQIHNTASLKPTAAIIPECSLVTNNIPALLVQPSKVELLSLDPYVVIYHNVISDTQLEDLRELVVEQDDMLELTKIGRKKMRQINGRLHYIIGHQGQELYDDWQVERYDFENLMELTASTSTSSTSTSNEKASQAKILFHLQQPIMGGAVVFPELDLSIHLPLGSLLYWSTLDEFDSEDYRSKYHICPVIGGTQLTAINTIQKL